MAWEVPRNALPIERQQLEQWEHRGQGPYFIFCSSELSDIATRATRLIADYVKHHRFILFTERCFSFLRNRADLFERVEKKVLSHLQHLETRGKALDMKLNKVSSQCETLIEDVKRGIV